MANQRHQTLEEKKKTQKTDYSRRVEVYLAQGIYHAGNIFGVQHEDKNREHPQSMASR